MRPRQCMHVVSCLSGILSLIYFISVADVFQNNTSFNLMQFLVGMHSVWDSVTLLFLLLAQRFIRKTLHSSRLHSWGFEWRSVLWLCTCTASCHACLLQAQCRWLYSGLSCTQTSPMPVEAGFGCPTIVPRSSPIYCPVMPSPDAAPPWEGTQTGRALVRKSSIGKGSNLLFGRSWPQPPAGCLAETVRKLRMTQKRCQRADGPGFP